MAELTTICPRCGCKVIQKLYSSPISGAWDILQCNQCWYAWRTTEPPRRRDRDAHHDSFKMTIEDIHNAPEMPTVPPLCTQS
jgi:vanillate/4-hydroxybenzoate decarboxylase subunit D